MGESLLRSTRNLLIIGVVCLTLSSVFCQSVQAQKTTTDNKLLKQIKSEEHSARKATLFSAVIPGWGQAYNKKYWKVPIVWAGLGGIGYLIYSNNLGYNNFKDHYIYLSENPDSILTVTISGTIENLTKDNLTYLLNGINEYRKNRDLSVLILFAWWGLNIIDANVDGHFFNFDIDEDLSLGLSPVTWRIQRNKPAFGLNLVLNLY